MARCTARACSIALFSTDRSRIRERGVVGPPDGVFAETSATRPSIREPFGGSVRRQSAVPIMKPGSRKSTSGLGSGAPVMAAQDTAIVGAANFQALNSLIRTAHDESHGFIGGTIGNAHTSFRDPF